MAGAVLEAEPSPAPPSPAPAQASVSDLMDELVRFTLSASLAEDTGISLGLSREYSRRLLQDDPSHLPYAHLNDAVGVPAYPLYKHLARTLGRCIKSGSFLTELRSVRGIAEDVEYFKVKRQEWDRLIVEKGLELVNMLEDVEFELHVQEPFLSQLRGGLKIVEGRCATGDYNRISAGALLLVNKCLLLKVQDIKHYDSFCGMLQVELSNALPGVQTIEEGVQIYRKFYTEEKEKSNGVLAIYILKVASQPYISLGNLLSGLGCEGIGSLLGMVHTAGTVPDSLPPPRSSLLSSSMKPRHLNIQGCNLTDVARSLAKHVHRSSEGWWGSFCGSDSEKNKLAFELIESMLNNCCWMNVYPAQPHGCIFEIRVPDGYGARWSNDGSKFIGFLEPYTEEGHSKGWKH